MYIIKTNNMHKVNKYAQNDAVKIKDQKKIFFNTTIKQ